MTTKKVTSMVDRLYGRMDALSVMYGVHKLETIGDAWVGVTNLYTPCPDDHVKRIALFSIEGEQTYCRIPGVHAFQPPFHHDILSSVTKAASQTLVDEEDPSLGYVKVRVGFHSGPCTAAVVGTRLPKFSVFG